MGERQFGPYRLVRQVAVGGMAEIHLAKTKGIAGFEKYVALKMIHPNFAEDEQFIDMLVDEAKIAVQLNHGNIAQTFDLGRVGDTFYITMEYVDGADLYKILRRSSEIDAELPLDICAVIAKEVASALDHAHRKRDHTGKTLGIVHRDVSPQNVLISYAGEVKLVDFGIAKATMKARQTAVGVIKGKYYYMSPEQARGDQIDHRSDIFSAGIVLYEMITGQMLYLEEDLHKLLDMARKADIAPPSTLRRGIPPQLERIVMHALEKDRRNRYQSASDFAADLERFLHTYSPVFTASKVAALIRKIIGEPTAVPDDEVEMRDGPMSTHTLTADDLILDKEELQDSNSVIFRVADLRPKAEAGRPAEPRKSTTAQPRAPSKPRDPNDETRQVSSPAPPGNTEDSGLLDLKTPPPPAQPVWRKRDAGEATVPSGELENVAESTMITGAPSAFGGFMMDVASEEGVDATVVSSGPPTPDEPAHDEDDDHETIMGARPEADEGGATVQRDFRDAAKPKVTKRGAAPPALAAKIHAPAVSELRKPRTSRKTPAGGVPAAQQNVLQAIVGSRPAEPMPAPRPATPQPPQQERDEDSGANTIPQQPSPVAGMPPPAAYNGYAADASGLPMTPPQGVTQYPPSPYQPYPPGYPPQPYYPQQGYAPAPVTPGGLYQLQPYGAPPPQPMTLTGQMRLFEADELGEKYKVTGGPKWIKLVIAGVIAVSVAAGVTFFIIKATRDKPPSVGTIRIDSVPPGAEVVFDGTRLAGTTPMTVDSVPIGTRHEVRVELARHTPHIETVDVPKHGGEVPIKAFLTPITGKVRVNTQPDGAEIWIDNQLRGKTPMTVTGIDMANAKVLELKMTGYETYRRDLEWPANGEITIQHTLRR